MRNREQVPENRHCTSNAPLLAFAHEISPMLDRVIEQLRRRRREPVLVRNLDPRVARAIALEQREQRRRRRGVQADAAMRGRTAEPRDTPAVAVNLNPALASRT